MKSMSIGAVFMLGAFVLRKVMPKAQKSAATTQPNLKSCGLLSLGEKEFGKPEKGNFSSISGVRAVEITENPIHCVRVVEITENPIHCVRTDENKNSKSCALVDGGSESIASRSLATVCLCVGLVNAPEPKNPRGPDDLPSQQGKLRRIDEVCDTAPSINEGMPGCSGVALTIVDDDIFTKPPKHPQTTVDGQKIPRLRNIADVSGVRKIHDRNPVITSGNLPPLPIETIASEMKPPESERFIHEAEGGTRSNGSDMKYVTGERLAEHSDVFDVKERRCGLLERAFEVGEIVHPCISMTKRFMEAGPKNTTAQSIEKEPEALPPGYAVFISPECDEVVFCFPRTGIDCMIYDYFQQQKEEIADSPYEIELKFEAPISQQIDHYGETPKAVLFWVASREPERYPFTPFKIRIQHPVVEDMRIGCVGNAFLDSGYYKVAIRSNQSKPEFVQKAWLEV